MLAPSRRYLYENFAPYLSKPYKKLLKFESSDTRLVYDCRYIVPKSYLKKQIKFYKNFIHQYPEFSKKHNVYNRLRGYQDDLKHYPNIIY